MKAAFLIALLVLAVLVPESDAGFFRRVGRKIKSGIRRVGSRIKEHVRQNGGAGRVIGGLVLRGILSRGKRSTLTLNQADDVNTVDIATTLNLDLTAVQELFVFSDVDKNGWLDGEELIAFIGMIEDVAGTTPQEAAIQASLAV